jgi:hypothetical protein
MSIDTKPCRHCRQPVAVDARLCQHCHGFQSWWANQRDPRYQLIWPVLVLALMAGFFLLMQRQFDPIEDRGEPPHLAVSDTSSRVVAASEGQRMFVLGRVQNTSSRDAATVWFRVNLFDDANHVVDSFLAQSPGLIVPGNGSVAFRVFGPLSVAAADVKRTEVTVERAKARSKWE